VNEEESEEDADRSLDEETLARYALSESLTLRQSGGIAGSLTSAEEISVLESAHTSSHVNRPLPSRSSCSSCSSSSSLSPFSFSSSSSSSSSSSGSAFSAVCLSCCC
jgi:hypothetical protein